MTDTKQSRLTATLLCVTPPDEHQEQGIRAFLQKKYGEDVALTIQQDASLKSGFQLHVGSEVYDWSAKGRMEQFRQQVEQLVAKNTRKDIIPLLRSSIDEFRLLAKSSEVGTVKSIGDGIAVVEGLEHAAYGEILMFDNGIKGMVQDLRRNETGCILFDNADDISAGSKVARTGKTAGVPVGDAFLGRVVDALGRPIDGGDAIPADGYRPVEEPAPGIIDRQSVDTPMETGLLSIDAMFPIGRGQRELIIGDRQTGKTAIALDAMLNQKGKNVICVYVAIGQKAVRALPSWWRTCASATQWITPSSSAQRRAKRTPCSTLRLMRAALWRIFHASGPRCAHCLRRPLQARHCLPRMSLLLERAPGREAYPGDVFYLHSRLLERSAHLSDAARRRQHDRHSRLSKRRRATFPLISRRTSFPSPTVRFSSKATCSLRVSARQSTSVCPCPVSAARRRQRRRRKRPAACVWTWRSTARWRYLRSFPAIWMTARRNSCTMGRA